MIESYVLLNAPQDLAPAAHCERPERPCRSTSRGPSVTADAFSAPSGPANASPGRTASPRSSYSLGPPRPGISSTSSRTASLCDAVRGEAEILKAVGDGVDLNEKNARGVSFLGVALERQDFDDAQLWLDLGADPEEIGPAQLSGEAAAILKAARVRYRERADKVLRQLLNERTKGLTEADRIATKGALITHLRGRGVLTVAQAKACAKGLALDYLLHKLAQNGDLEAAGTVLSDALSSLPHGETLWLSVFGATGHAVDVLITRTGSDLAIVTRNRGDGAKWDQSRTVPHQVTIRATESAALADALKDNLRRITGAGDPITMDDYYDRLERLPGARVALLRDASQSPQQRGNCVVKSLLSGLSGLISGRTYKTVKPCWAETLAASVDTDDARALLSAYRRKRIAKARLERALKSSAAPREADVATAIDAMIAVPIATARSLGRAAEAVAKEASAVGSRWLMREATRLVAAAERIDDAEKPFSRFCADLERAILSRRVSDLEAAVAKALDAWRSGQKAGWQDVLLSAVHGIGCAASAKDGAEAVALCRRWVRACEEATRQVSELPGDCSVVVEALQVELASALSALSGAHFQEAFKENDSQGALLHYRRAMDVALQSIDASTRHGGSPGPEIERIGKAIWNLAVLLRRSPQTALDENLAAGIEALCHDLASCAAKWPELDWTRIRAVALRCLGMCSLERVDRSHGNDAQARMQHSERALGYLRRAVELGEREATDDWAIAINRLGLAVQSQLKKHPDRAQHDRLVTACIAARDGAVRYGSAKLRECADQALLSAHHSHGIGLLNRADTLGKAQRLAEQVTCTREVIDTACDLMPLDRALALNLWEVALNHQANAAFDALTANYDPALARELDQLGERGLAFAASTAHAGDDAAASDGIAKLRQQAHMIRRVKEAVRAHQAFGEAGAQSRSRGRLLGYIEAASHYLAAAELAEQGGVQTAFETDARNAYAALFNACNEALQGGIDGHTRSRLAQLSGSCLATLRRAGKLAEAAQLSGYMQRVI